MQWVKDCLLCSAVGSLAFFMLPVFLPEGISSHRHTSLQTWNLSSKPAFLLLYIKACMWICFYWCSSYCWWVVVCLIPQFCWCGVYRRFMRTRRRSARSQLLASVSSFLKQVFLFSEFLLSLSFFCSFSPLNLSICLFVCLLDLIQSVMLWQAQHCGCFCPSLVSPLIGNSYSVMRPALVFPYWLFATRLVFVSSFRACFKQSWFKELCLITDSIRTLMWLTCSGCEASNSHNAVNRDDCALAASKPCSPTAPLTYTQLVTHNLYHAFSC